MGNLTSTVSGVRTEFSQLQILGPHFLPSRSWRLHVLSFLAHYYPSLEVAQSTCILEPEQKCQEACIMLGTGRGAREESCDIPTQCTNQH
jgi:hypothetical protein